MFCNYSHSDYIPTKKGHSLKSVLWQLTKLEIQWMPQFTVLLSLRVEFIVSKKDSQNKKLAINELEYNLFSQDSSACSSGTLCWWSMHHFGNFYYLPCTCPIGLKPIQSDIECKCDCDLDLQQYQITNCSEDHKAGKWHVDRSCKYYRVYC